MVTTKKRYFSEYNVFLSFINFSLISSISVAIPLHLVGVFFPSFPKEHHSSVPCCIVHAQPPICSAHSAAASETSRWLKRQIALTKKKKRQGEKMERGAKSLTLHSNAIIAAFDAGGRPFVVGASSLLGCPVLLLCT